LSEDEVKAGFIFNFLKYTEWPAASPGSELRVCALDAQPLSGRLEALQGRRIEEREIRVTAPTRPSALRGCQALYIPAGERARAEAALRAIDQHPVLTICEAPGCVRDGSIIGLKLRGGRMRFDINQGAARQAGLKLSSQLLKLADDVLP
jgi:hypothetical protein